jgi:LmbE family N-acetylglucosaminyl deacetylase
MGVRRHRRQVPARAPCEVAEAAFSFTDDETLRDEWRKALAATGVDRDYEFTYPVRHFPDHRQAILDSMLTIKNDFEPDMVFVPSTYDTHQDHKTIREEAFRAFKSCTILGYELPWNNIGFSATCFVELSEADVALKRKACGCFQSQANRPYFPGTFINSWARMRGVQIGVKYAEAFEVIRWRM